MQSVEERLAMLEGSSRRWRTLACALGVALVSITSVGADKPELSRGPESRKASAGAQKSVPVMADADGRGFVSTFNGKNQRLVTIGATGDGQGRVTVFDGLGQKVIDVAGSPDEPQRPN